MWNVLRVKSDIQCLLTRENICVVCQDKITIYAAKIFYMTFTHAMALVLMKVSNYHKIDPLGRPTVTAGGDRCFSTCCPSVRLYVRPHFLKSSKTKQISSENNVHYLRDCGSGRVDH